MDISKYSGLSSEEAEKQVSLGLSNTIIDTKTPSYLEIFFRQLFNLSNITLAPLLAALFFFSVYRDVLVLSFVILSGALVETLEEIRVKRRLDELKDRFRSTAKVIRDGELKEIPSDQVVSGDTLVCEEGDTFLADGEVIDSEYLQVDESALTGESDYITKEKDSKVMAGSFTVTGICVYKVTGIGEDNYLNKLASESTKFDRKRSGLEKNMSTLIYIFTAIGFTAAILNFVVAKVNGYETKQILIGITSVMSNITPQVILIILLVTFIISVTKLAGKGILIQKKGAIDELATIDVICMDKTGTITTNDMKIKESYFYNSSEIELKEFYEPIFKHLYGINKTALAIFDFLKLKENSELKDADHFKQVPFTSDNKFTKLEYKDNSIAIGAFSKLKNHLTNELSTQAEEMIKDFEKKGYRVLFGLMFNDHIIDNTDATTDKYFVLGIDEELNPGIREILDTLRSQNINLRIISGDSLVSVQGIMEKVGISSDKIIDLSTFDGNLEDVVSDHIVFARAVPADKLKIVNLLQSKGLKVAMVGDGVNDVLGIKNSDVGIAMETGAKVARDVSDIVLLGNDYTKIPEIFYEGDNILFNIKLTAKMYFSRAVIYGMISLFFTIFLQKFVPINPTSTLVPSFIGNSLIGYLLTFSRNEVNDQRSFLKDIIYSSVPAGILGSLAVISIYIFNSHLDDLQMNTALTYGILGVSAGYTLFLLWDSGKVVKNIFLFGAVMLMVIYIGGILPILPVRLIEGLDKQLFAIFTLIIGGIFFSYLIKVGAKFANLEIGRKVKITSIVMPLIVFVLAYAFPVKTYFAITGIPFSSYPSIILSIILFEVGMILVHVLVIDKIMENENKSKSKYKLIS